MNADFEIHYDFKLYKYIWLSRGKHPFGNVVYRDSPDRKVSAEEYAEVHGVATFIFEDEAQNYCDYRNHMTEKHGNDDVAMIKEYDYGQSKNNS